MVILSDRNLDRWTFCQTDILSSGHFELVILSSGHLSSGHFVKWPFRQVAILSSGHFVKQTFTQMSILSNQPFCRMDILSIGHFVLSLFKSNGHFSTRFIILSILEVQHKLPCNPANTVNNTAYIARGVIYGLEFFITLANGHFVRCLFCQMTIL